MNKTIVLILISLLFFSTSHATIFGDDDRGESTDPKMSSYTPFSRAVAALIDVNEFKSFRKYRDKDYIEFKVQDPSPTYEREYKLCGKDDANPTKDDEFRAQIIHAHCTGFMVSPSHLLTPQHCIPNQEACNRNLFIFNYNLDPVTNNAPLTVKKANVFKCKRIIDQSPNKGSQVDYSLLELELLDHPDSEVKLPYLKLNLRNRPVKTGDKVFAIGHPLGLPQKISTNAMVVYENIYSFDTNLDTFGGNSGSPVIEESSQEVVGMLVGGSFDFRYDYDKKCNVPKTCTSLGLVGTHMLECYGETVQNFSAIRDILSDANK